MDNTVTPKITAEFLRKAQKNGELIIGGEDIPKTFIITAPKKKKTVMKKKKAENKEKTAQEQKVIFSHISAKTLVSRATLPLT